MRHALMIALAAFNLYIAVPASIAGESNASGPVQITDVAKGKTPSIAAGDGTLHIAYQNDSSIFYSASSDEGKSWSAQANVSGKGQSCSLPAIATGADGSVNIVWQDKPAGENEIDIFYARSADGGKNWSEPTNISKTTTASSEPELAVGPDNSVHIVWIDALSGPKCPDVYYTCSKDGGKTWSNKEDISNTPGVCTNPAIAAGTDGAVHVAWMDTSSGETHPDILYVCKSDNGWTKWKDISNSPRFSTHPSIGCGPKGKVYLVWSDNSRKEHSADIWCAISHRNGNFGKPINISNSRGVSNQPVIAVDQTDRLAVVWSDTSASLTVPDIWARTGLAEGFSNVLQLCQTEGLSVHPSVTTANKKAYVVWEEVEGSKSTVRGCFVPISIAVGPAENVDAIHYGHSR